MHQTELECAARSVAVRAAAARREADAIGWSREPARILGAFICGALVGLPGEVGHETVRPMAIPRLRSPGLPGGLSILAGLEEKPGGSLWYHVSLARPDRMPAYSDLAAARRICFRPEATVLQVFPPAAEHVNDHEYCLHLWQCLGGWEPPPDLRQLDSGRLSL